MLDNIDLVGADILEISLYVGVQFLVVDDNLAEAVAEQVAENAAGFIEFTQQFGGWSTSFQLLEHLFPFADEVHQFFVEFLYLFTFGGSSDNETEILGFDTFCEGVESFSFFGAGNFFWRRTHCRRKER